MTVNPKRIVEQAYRASGNHQAERIFVLDMHTLLGVLDERGPKLSRQDQIERHKLRLAILHSIDFNKLRKAVLENLEHAEEIDALIGFAISLDEAGIPAPFGPFGAKS